MKKDKLPEFLRELPRVDFVRRPARTRKELEREDVIFDVKSLDDLFDKAKGRNLLPKKA